jgi:hypothetical protein
MIWLLVGLFVGFPLGWVACALVASGAEADERMRMMLDALEAVNDPLPK